MLIIRGTQLEAFEQNKDIENIALLRNYFTEFNRSELLGDTKDIDKALLEAVQMARKIGAETIATAASLFAFFRHVHPRFAEHPFITEILNDNSTPADARPGLLLAFGSYDDWQLRCVEVFGA